LPRSARLPINRCNLPAVILGSLTFQRHPTPLVIDGVAELHRDFFIRLDHLKLPHQRAEVFRDYMTVAFRLDVPLTKVLFHCTLLPGVLQGEGEYLVIGGAYGVNWATL
jgi:hypothetical protein